ncbi:MAG TPA: peptidylprolyl isomerase [Polyangia bacterium]|jgi:FKBP-type peptidyl-prolyl cis-trans isomerase 2|nr:peptidylprolyl isomerase [Polyangia bacterium]
MKIATGHIVKIELELKVKGGELVESSAKTGPVEFVQGKKKILPGLEKQLEGMAVGQEKKGVIPAREAFGLEEDLPTKPIPRREFPAGTKLDVGQLFEAKGPEGQPVSFKVVKVDSDNVTVRFLHPLAGKDLEFKVKVLAIEDPTTDQRVVAVPPPPPAALKSGEKRK